MKSLACTGMLLSSLLLSGCFYLIEPGRGGVAERFSHRLTTAAEQEINRRLQHCRDSVAQKRKGAAVRPPPAWFEQVEQHLVLSQRYLSAGYPAQAEQALGRAEQMLISTVSGTRSTNTSSLTYTGGTPYDFAENNRRPAAVSVDRPATAGQ